MNRFLDRSLIFIVLLLLYPSLLQADLRLTGRFEFNGDFTDSLGNLSDMTELSRSNESGSFSNSSYVFGNDVGLCLFNEFASFRSDYKIEMDVSFSDLDGWDKLIDYSYLSDDDGFYINNGPENALTYYPLGPVGGSIETGNQYTISLERLGSTDARTVIASINGTEVWRVDNSSFANTGLPFGQRAIYFFIDDSTTNGREGVAGAVDEIRIYTPVTIPEPNSVGLLGLLGLSFLSHRRRQS